MDSQELKPEELTNLTIQTLGERKFPFPPFHDDIVFTNDNKRVLVFSDISQNEQFFKKNQKPPAFESAGPRTKIFFDPKRINCALVTCGGLCPGLNDMIRTVSLSLLWQYNVKKVFGFRYGYNGLAEKPNAKPLELTPEIVDEIQHEGGTILGSSRGAPPVAEMVETLKKYNISILFTIGGDGTFRGAHEIVKEIEKQKLPISVIAIPKTIDNDIYACERTFGFNTSVEQARHAIYIAHEEAKAAWNGIGLVKLMGRDAGFIAAHATLANSDVNFCFIPEAPFKLEGENGLLCLLKQRLEKKRHAVIVVAEGAGQDLVQGKEKKTDASGNVRYKDIGLFLKERITDFSKEQNIPLTIKYIDPSYTIRSCPANADDSAFCLMLGQNAVHAGMAGKTDMFVSFWHHYFTHVPLSLATLKKKKIDTRSSLWQTLLETTGQMGRCYY